LAGKREGEKLGHYSGGVGGGCRAIRSDKKNLQKGQYSSLLVLKKWQKGQPQPQEPLGFVPEILTSTDDENDNYSNEIRLLKGRNRIGERGGKMPLTNR